MAPVRTTEVEGVSEYRLPNGCRVLIYPDAAAQVLTVNMTVLVGSRHEGYVPTFPEMLNEIRKAKVPSLKSAYALLSGSHGKLTMVGAFQQDAALKQLNQTLTG